jgi:hypothetical protein
MAVSEQAILDALHQVSAQRWDEVLHFLETLKNDVSPIRTGAEMAKSEFGLQVGRDNRIDALVAGGGRINFIGHGITPVLATAGVTVSVRI